MYDKQKLHTSIATLEKQIENIRASHRDKELNIGDLETRHKDLIRENESLSEELKVCRDRFNKSNASIAKLVKDHES